jgi:stearoyl-CoA desaturase (Delta-9 desaturase)
MNNKIDRRYLLFLAQLTTPFLLIWALFTYATPIWIIVSFLVFALLRGVGVTITYHRILAHNTHRMHPIVEFIGTSLGFYGSLSTPMAFCATHNTHHRYVDTEKDPHPNMLLGWKAMFPLFWNGKAPTYGYDLRTVARLKKNKTVMFFEKYYWFLLLLPFSLLLISLEAYLFLYLVPLSLSLLGLAVSVFNHDENGPKTMNWLFGLITMGEHKHKWHHDNPGDTTGEGLLNNVIELITIESNYKGMRNR